MGCSVDRLIASGNFFGPWGIGEMLGTHSLRICIISWSPWASAWSQGVCSSSSATFSRTQIDSKRWAGRSVVGACWCNSGEMLGTHSLRIRIISWSPRASARSQGVCSFSSVTFTGTQIDWKLWAGHSVVAACRCNTDPDIFTQSMRSHGQQGRQGQEGTR